MSLYGSLRRIRVGPLWKREKTPLSLRQRNDEAAVADKVSEWAHADAAACQQREPDNARSRLLAVATEIAWKNGIDAIRTREITRLANANSSSINYYFGSRDGLAREILLSLMGPYVSARLKCLDDYEKGATTIEIEKVIEALVRPMVTLSRAEMGERPLIRILMQVRGHPEMMMNSVFAEKVDPVALRFINAMSRALPGMDRATLFWRYNFMLGAIMQILMDSDSGSMRLHRLSSGICDTSDDERIVRELVGFLAGGMKAPEAMSADAAQRA